MEREFAISKQAELTAASQPGPVRIYLHVFFHSCLSLCFPCWYHQGLYESQNTTAVSNAIFGRTAAPRCGYDLKRVSSSFLIFPHLSSFYPVLRWLPQHPVTDAAPGTYHNQYNCLGIFEKFQVDFLLIRV